MLWVGWKNFPVEGTCLSRSQGRQETGGWEHRGPRVDRCLGSGPGGALTALKFEFYPWDQGAIEGLRLLFVT